MMSPAPSSDALRAYAAARVAATSAHAVAAAIGVSTSALKGFLDGRSPYAHFRMKLIELWSREHARLPSISDPGVHAALGAILGGVAPDRRPEALAALTDTLRRLHAAHPDRCPAWVADLVHPAAVGTEETGRGAAEAR